MTRRDPAFAIVDQPQVHDVYRRWRQIANEYEPDRVLVGEIFGPQRQSRYILPDQLSTAFGLFRPPWNANAWRRSIDVDMRTLRGPAVAPTWALSNHDIVRHITRFGGGSTGRDRARAALLLLLGLPGQVVLYQGEELGLEEVDLAPEVKQDPLFIHTVGRQPGRDGCRVPLPWVKGKPNAGFSLKTPWLPQPPGWDRWAADAEEASWTSMLAFYKRALALRRRLSQWVDTSIAWRPAPDGVLVYKRGRLTVACNFLQRPVAIPACGTIAVASAELAGLKDGWLTLPASSAAWVDSLGS
jgi:alpha-glucosidase